MYTPVEHVVPTAVVILASEAKRYRPIGFSSFASVFLLLLTFSFTWQNKRDPTHSSNPNLRDKDMPGCAAPGTLPY